jgi:hypothetical protein
MISSKNHKEAQDGWDLKAIAHQLVVAVSKSKVMGTLFQC